MSIRTHSLSNMYGRNAKKSLQACMHTDTDENTPVAQRCTDSHLPCARAKHESPQRNLGCCMDRLMLQKQDGFHSQVNLPTAVTGQICAASSQSIASSLSRLTHIRQMHHAIQVTVTPKPTAAMGSSSSSEYAAKDLPTINPIQAIAIKEPLTD